MIGKEGPMKLTILVDNNTLIDDEISFFGEPALCYYIEDGDKRILFDTGYSDIFLKNAALRGVDLKNLTHVVLSHGHNDHTNGLAHLWQAVDTKDVTLITHPLAFRPKALPTGDIGAPYTEEEAARHMKLQLSREPVAITERLLYLGEIPRTNDFENKEPLGRIRLEQGWEDDFLPDDSALAYRGKNGLYIITGCSHCGICNIVEYARKLTGVREICGIIGGFHLLQEDRRLERTIDYLEENTDCALYPCHCVSLAAKFAMARRLPVREVGVGMQFIME